VLRGLLARPARKVRPVQSARLDLAGLPEQPAREKLAQLALVARQALPVQRALVQPARLALPVRLDRPAQPDLLAQPALA
jgi:hypothetical protein